MSKPKVWTLPALLDRIWAAVPISRKTIVHDSGGVPHRVVTAYDEDYKDRTYHLNKIGAPVAAALYERIKAMRAADSKKDPRWLGAWSEGYDTGFAAGRAKWPQQLDQQFAALSPLVCNCPSPEQLAAQGFPPGHWIGTDCPIHGSGGI